MYVNATEFRTNVGKYLDIISTEDVIIIKHGRPIATLSSSRETKLRMLDSLAGSYKYDGDLEDLLEKRLEDS
ncbi:MAG: type II toxin-antitoxin system Phd/YefM family antitoxin [Candidatus Methanoplasma sp.]|jgi:antitoxin (DNA-binding transcriptional repressor) of toxin-antitoxin stability system|nr:type II toxin-antitoxin system Phd/YefM family antitoxin [Candidatus Methanoplasma sp.]